MSTALTGKKKTVKKTRQEIAADAREARLKKKSHKQNRPQPTQAIAPDKVYPIRLLPTLFGIGRWTIRKAERDGLRIEGLGNAKFVCGADLIQHIFGKAKQSE